MGVAGLRGQDTRVSRKRVVRWQQAADLAQGIHPSPSLVSFHAGRSSTDKTTRFPTAAKACSS